VIDTKGVQSAVWAWARLLPARAVAIVMVRIRVVRGIEKLRKLGSGFIQSRVARVVRMALIGACYWRKVPLSKPDVLMDEMHYGQSEAPLLNTSFNAF
jgi:hypothetical protein